MTKAQLARILDVNPAALSNWEKSGSALNLRARTQKAWDSISTLKKKKGSHEPTTDRDNDSITLGDLIEGIIVDAYGEDEQLSAFCQVIEDEVPLPVDGFVIGEPVSVLEIDYEGNERRGLTAKCRRMDGSDHVVAASEVVFLKGYEMP